MNLYNEKVILLISFCCGLFINMGTIYISTIYFINKYGEIKEFYIKNKGDLVYIDNLLAFIVGVIIQEIYIPFFILSLLIGFFLNREYDTIDYNIIKNNVIVKEINKFLQKEVN